ncbi:uncharacterized protein [Typha angustifolia]|uniref:uncharacterized protein n=1 Tax=Typha angustifolia TaxID=59011 RepID=UPI003C2F240D
MASTGASLKEYLKRYQSGAEDPNKAKKKKRKKEKPKSDSRGGVLVVDEDPVWQKPVQIEEEESDSAGEELPQVDEDIEVKRMKRLEAIRARKPYHSIADDGSGWVPISEPAKPSDVAGGPYPSPPRQQRARYDTPSPELEREPSDAERGDLSPPRQPRRRLDTPSPERGEKGANLGDDEVGDMSPPRKSHKRIRIRSKEDLSPPHHVDGRHKSEKPADLSPPRRSRARRSPEDERPGRSSASGLSPPRRSRARPSLEDERPGRSSTADLSPPRRSRAHHSPDGKPGRPSAADLSPPRRSQKGLSDDLSPPRRPHRNSTEITNPQISSEDLSPPRKGRKEAYLVKGAPRSGLFSAQEIKEEINKKKKQEKSRFAAMDPSMTGKDAEPVFRDKEGKRISKEEITKEKEEKPKFRSHDKLEWGKGLAQKREVEAKALELELEKDKPFARTRDDPDLDKMLKERVRWGDPMAHLVKRKSSEPVLEDLGDNEKMKDSGFIIPQTIPSHSWLKRGIDCPPNRYGIRPGRHWDGVDRSSGYEKEMFKRQNEKRATEQEAYLWSVSDM